MPGMRDKAVQPGSSIRCGPGSSDLLRFRLLLSESVLSVALGFADILVCVWMLDVSFDWFWWAPTSLAAALLSQVLATDAEDRISRPFIWPSGGPKSLKCVQLHTPDYTGNSWGIWGAASFPTIVFSTMTLGDLQCFRTRRPPIDRRNRVHIFMRSLQVIPGYVGHQVIRSSGRGLT
jgi:hypothetical protein